MGVWTLLHEKQNNLFKNDEKQKVRNHFPIIQDLIISNSIIWTDEFSVYTRGPNYKETHTPLALLSPYDHYVVNHSVNYKDSITRVHINNIEAFWNSAKTTFKQMYGAKIDLVPRDLDEFMWRKRYVLSEDTKLEAYKRFNFV